MQLDKIALNCDWFDFEDVVTFITLMSHLKGGTQGSRTKLWSSLNMKDSDALKVFLGMREISFEQQNLFETLHRVTFNYFAKPDPGQPDIWLDSPNWRFTNPRHDRQAALKDCQLDLEYVDSFGLAAAAWEKDVFKGTYKYQQTNEAQQFRLFVALGVFGFPDPMQFFIPR